MNFYYINLRTATERRLLIEEEFKKHALPNMQLKRVEAIDGKYASQNSTLKSNLKPAEIGCLLSHKKAIEMSLEDDGHCMIFEDDASVGPKGFRLINELFRSQEMDVDIIFTNCLVSNTDFILQQVLLYKNSVSNRKINFLNMAELHTAGAE